MKEREKVEERQMKEEVTVMKEKAGVAEVVMDAI